MNEKKVILTYGTFDLFHVGHLKVLKRLKGLGSFLIVGVSTDEFNEKKGKKTIIKFRDRAEIISNLKCVDMTIPEESWEQKISDIKKHKVSIFGMGHDWEGHFDDLKVHCEVIYFPRTEGISSTDLKKTLHVLDKSHIVELKKTLDIISSIVERFD